MNEQIKALIAQENAAQYFKRIERWQAWDMSAADTRKVLTRMQARAAHHAAIARAALNID